MNITIKQVRGRSGIDVWAENLCRGIRSQGHTCTLDLQPVLYQFFPVLGKFSKNPGNPDILHGNTWNGYAFKSEVPLVVTEHHVVHDPAYYPYRSLPQKIYHRWIYRCEQKTFAIADAVTCVSWYTKKKLEESFGYTDAKVIYNGIDISVFRSFRADRSAFNLPHNKTLLFFAGNLSRRKGADLLPAIMNALGEDYLLLTATGQQGLALQDRKNIRNLGRLRQDQLVEIYNLCDIFLFPSRLEGFGLSVAEAMACAKPVIATNGSSLPELIIDGKGGFLCRMDDVKDFTGKISYIAEDINMQKEMGIFNRQRVLENFTIEKMAREYISLYKSVIG